MFAGIVETIGRVVARSAVTRRARAGEAARLTLAAPHGYFADLPPGASVAVQGVCLTLVDQAADQAGFDVIPETLRNTTLGALEADQPVNLERALRVGDRIDGHFVQGHVDGVGQVRRVERAGGEWILWIEPPAGLRPYIVRKGSIAIDGTSLTIAAVSGACFSVALIPATLERTTLGKYEPGAPANLETDILARLTIARLEELVGTGGGETAGLTLERLRENGFAP